MVDLPGVAEQLPGAPLTVLDEADSGLIQRSVTAEGVRVLTQRAPVGRAATVGVAVPVGSRDESTAQAGASHFLEHLLFKGTGRRSALEISAAIDAVGGDLNAFTGKEYTCYYARVLDRDVPLALDVLLDMVLDATLAEHDIDSERQVVISEIAMYDDDPASVAQEMFTEQVFAGSPLAPPIAATAEQIAVLPAAAIRGHYRRWYQPKNLAVVAAGRIDHEAVVDSVAQALARYRPDGVGADAVTLPRRVADRGLQVPQSPPAEVTSRVRTRDVEQSNVVTGGVAINRTDPRKYALAVLNSAVGGGMSSRLFQQVREQRGLAYTVQSFTTLYSDTGSFGVFTATAPDSLDEALTVIGDVLDEVAREGITDDELHRGIGQACGGLVLAREEPSARMVQLAEAELITGSLTPVSEALSRLEGVTHDAVAEVAQTVLGAPRHVAVVGPGDPTPQRDAATQPMADHQEDA